MQTFTAQNSSPPSSGRGSAARKKLLIVEDSYTALSMMRSMLATLPCEILTAADGQEAVERALSERPDLVLMDVEMPRLDGFEACRRIRQNGATKRMTIILVTHRDHASHVRKGFECGCNAYVTKPVDYGWLLSKIRNYLGV